MLDRAPGRVAQSVTCLATDASLTADPGVAISIPARSHTFVEIDHEIISTVILLPSAESFKKAGFYTKLNVWGSLGLNFEYDGGPIIEIGGPIFLYKLRFWKVPCSTTFREGSVFPGQ